MMTTFGEADFRYKSVAAAIPPGNTLQFARDIRRSPNAFSIVAMDSELSQNACSVICGIRCTGTTPETTFSDGGLPEVCSAGVVIGWSSGGSETAVVGGSRCVPTTSASGGSETTVVGGPRCVPTTSASGSSDGEFGQSPPLGTVLGASCQVASSKLCNCDVVV